MEDNICEILKAVRDGDRKAFHKLEELAEAGEPQALRELAIIFRDGKFGVQADGVKAVEYLTREIERDKGKSLDEISDRYLKNCCGDDMSDANEYSGDLAEICNVYTFQDIAQIFLEGRGGVKSNGQKALEYLFRAEEALDNAINFTKTFVEVNRPKVLRRIFRWGRRCKKNICLKIAEVYLTGKAGVRPDGAKAISQLEKIIRCYDESEDECSQKGIAHAHMQIAEIFLEGRGGIPVDGHKAIEHFDKASAFDKVAELYRYGKAKVQINPQKAIEYLLRYVDEICRNNRSANTADNVKSSIDGLNLAEAFRGIAEIYLTLDNGERALEYFLKADECGDEWAYINIAQLSKQSKAN